MIHNVSKQSRPGLTHDHSGEHCPACAEKRHALQNKLRQWDQRREQAVTTQTIQNLHLLCTPVTVISSRLHLPEPIVRYIIQRQMWPQTTLFECQASR